jgi:hypothetical protein
MRLRPDKLTPRNSGSELGGLGYVKIAFPAFVFELEMLERHRVRV